MLYCIHSVHAKLVVANRHQYPGVNVHVPYRPEGKAGRTIEVLGDREARLTVLIDFRFILT